MGKKDIKGIYMDYEMIECSTDNHAHHNKQCCRTAISRGGGGSLQ